MREGVRSIRLKPNRYEGYIQVSRKYRMIAKLREGKALEKFRAELGERTPHLAKDVDWMCRCCNDPDVVEKLELSEAEFKAFRKLEVRRDPNLQFLRSLFRTEKIRRLRIASDCK